MYYGPWNPARRTMLSGSEGPPLVRWTVALFLSVSVTHLVWWTMVSGTKDHAIRFERTTFGSKDDGIGSKGRVECESVQAPRAERPRPARTSPRPRRRRERRRTTYLRADFSLIDLMIGSYFVFCYYGTNVDFKQATNYTVFQSSSPKL